MLRAARNIIPLLVLFVSLVVPPDAYSDIAGDLNQDHIVDSKDLCIFAWQWLDPGCLVPGCVADLDGCCGVNMSDLALLANNWKKMVQHLVISEFMAKNCGTLLDGNGEASDWIEIYNPTDKVISLNGWYLTNDEDDDLGMWQFPGGLDLKPGEFIIVFASKKTYEENPYNYPYLDSLGYYHTNFELDESEGYLALVAPDSDTIIHEYPQYPEQLTDVSYGLAQYATVLLPTGATASYHVPDSNDAALGAGWTATDFNDSTWDTGTTGIGFGSSVSGEVATNVEGDMLGINASLWARVEFDLEEGVPDVYNTLELRMKYEDGFAAYLNGYLIPGRNSPYPLQWNSTALVNRPIEDALVFDEINLTAYMDLLQTGRNMLAIHGLNDHKSDGEFLILPELVVAAYTHSTQYFTSPTPETFNVSGHYGMVEDVWFSHERGFYDGPFQLILSTGTDGAEIHYTLDGSWPTISNGYIYASPLDVNETTIVRAVAIKPGWLNSKVETHTYIFLDNAIRQPNNPLGFPSSGWGHAGPDYEMDPCVVNNPLYSGTIKDDLKSVPTLSLVMNVDDLFSPLFGIYVNRFLDDDDYDGGIGERPVSAEFLNYSCAGDDDNEDLCVNFQVDAGVSILESSLTPRWRIDKLPMKLKFRCSYGPDKLRVPLFGDEAAGEFKSLVLNSRHSNVWTYSGTANIAQYTRNQFVSDIQNAMGGYAPYGRYVHLYVNGLYWGLYCVHEEPDEYFAASYMGGDEQDYDVLKDNPGNVINGSPANYYEMFSIANSGLGSDSKYQLIQQYLDVPNLIDYIITNFYVGNWDWAHRNWYASRSRVDPAGRWRYHSWLAEHVLEGLYDNVTGRFDSLAPTGLHQRLTQNFEYRLLFADHVHKHFFNGGLLTPEGAIALYHLRFEQVDRAVVGESARWGDNRREPPYTRNAEWMAERDRLLNMYFPQRTVIVLNQLKNMGLYPSVDAPVFYINGSYQHGGEISTDDVLTIDNPNPLGMIYYTLDGSDPRQPVTGNPVGTQYTVPIALNKSTHVKARVRDGATWSALCEAIFTVGPVAQNLRITEIMYDPRYDPDSEFIELKNIGPNTLNTNMVKFTEGIDFTFPDMELEPNEHVVVVKDLSAFEAQYGVAVNVAGAYDGSLDEAGERIRLEDANGQTILDFQYSDEWYPITDGDGFSLNIIEPGDSAIYSSEGLVAHWKFDDGSGSTAIDSAGTNHGTLYGDPNWTTGRINGALSFDGNGDYVSAAAIAPLTSDNLTMQAWIRLDQFAGIWNPFLTQPDANTNGYYFYVANYKPAAYILNGPAVVQVISTETINTEQWYHVAATNDGSSLKLYVDGRLKDSASSSGFTGANGDAFIGFEPAASLCYTGLIDDVRIYNRPVSEREFQEIANPMARWSRKDSWRPSVYRNGTPGWDDSGILPNPGAIVINEVMVVEDDDDDDFTGQNYPLGDTWIELHNTTDKPIDIGGWFLSSEIELEDGYYEVDEPNLMKYRIANGTKIDANDYIVFYEDVDFGNLSDPGCMVPFTVGGEDGTNTGGAVWLSSRLDPNGYLTGYRQVQVFGVAQRMVSFGRHYKSSTDTFDFVAMDHNTPDANNAGPKVGPVVINEIMYNPPTGYQNEEYIELRNITAYPVTLYRYDKSTPWKFTDGIDYIFPHSPPVTIPPYGFLLVVKDKAAFTAMYGSMPPGVQVLGDYDGRLSNDSGTVELSMPDELDWDGDRFYILIDRIDYSDGSHDEDCPGGIDFWPTGADGLGLSLSRKNPNDYGNDVANWKAAAPSPGAENN